MINPLYTFPDNFETIKNAGKGVSLILRGGQRVEGKIASWTQDVVVLTELVGQETHDALVRISEISGFSVAVR